MSARVGGVQRRSPMSRFRRLQHRLHAGRSRISPSMISRVLPQHVPDRVVEQVVAPLALSHHALGSRCRTRSGLRWCDFTARCCSPAGTCHVVLFPDPVIHHHTARGSSERSPSTAGSSRLSNAGTRRGWPEAPQRAALLEDVGAKRPIPCTPMAKSISLRREALALLGLTSARRALISRGGAPKRGVVQVAVHAIRGGPHLQGMSLRRGAPAPPAPRAVESRSRAALAPPPLDVSGLTRLARCGMNLPYATARVSRRSRGHPSPRRSASRSSASSPRGFERLPFSTWCPPHDTALGGPSSGSGFHQCDLTSTSWARSVRGRGAPPAADAARGRGAPPSCAGAAAAARRSCHGAAACQEREAASCFAMWVPPGDL